MAKSSNPEVCKLLSEFSEGVVSFAVKVAKDNHRYRSWERCYFFFQDVKKKGTWKLEIDRLCLELGFYLASWGMLRGSSFLLWCDSDIHASIMDILFDSRYDELWHVTYDNLVRNSGRIMDLKKRISEKYEIVSEIVGKDLAKEKAKLEIKVGKEVKEDPEEKIEKAVSDVLITKILMGTMGCVPAYDTYFRSGIHGSDKIARIGRMVFNEAALQELATFYCDYKCLLEFLRYAVSSSCGVDYPQMKILDMGFWSVGKIIDAEKKVKKRKKRKSRKRRARSA